MHISFYCYEFLDQKLLYAKSDNFVIESLDKYTLR